MHLAESSSDLLPLLPISPYGEDGGGAFTRYLRSLSEGNDGDSQAFDEMWDALEAALRDGLRKRSLWNRPPSYLGVYGWPRWSCVAEGTGRTASPIEELLVDAYTFIFIHRLPRLKAHLAVKPNVDGLVRLYLGNFLHDRQKKCDPMGYRVYEVLCKAVREAVEAGELRIAHGSDKIKANTLLACRETPAAGWMPIRAEKLEPLVETLADALLPDFFTAAGPNRKQVRLRLRHQLENLSLQGVKGFWFRDLNRLMTRVIRLRWAALYDLEEGESHLAEDSDGYLVLVRMTQPDVEWEKWHTYEKTVELIAGALEARLQEVSPGRACAGEACAETATAREAKGAEATGSDPTPAYLRTLWEFLRCHAQQPGPPKVPSNRKLSKLLGIPRQQLPRLYEMLREIIQASGLPLPPEASNEPASARLGRPKP